MHEFINADKTMYNLTNHGAFLVSGKQPNVMTISWGMIGVLWGKKVMLVPVRESRYTKQFIDITGEFTVSVPYSKMSKELMFCGKNSGRDVDKFEAMDLKRKHADRVNTYYIDGCEKHYECKVLTSFRVESDKLPKEILDGAYKNGDFHTLYIAEILEG